MVRIENIFKMPPPPLPEELTTVLAVAGAGGVEGSGVRIERIVSTGQASGWYDQDEFEFVALLEGEAVIEFAGGTKTAFTKGDAIIIEPHERHRVTYTSADPPCVWLCVFWR